MAKTKKPISVKTATPKINRPPMPKATAAWLIENTSLTARQIADFCGIHFIEVQVMFNESKGQSVRATTPIGLSLTREEIEKGEKDPAYRLEPSADITDGLAIKKPKSKKYVSGIQKRERLEAALWLISFSHGLSDKQMSKLLGSAPSTIKALRNKTYKNITNLVPKSPVTVGLCTMDEINDQIAIAKKTAETNE